MSWFADSNGTIFTTPDGQAPGNAGVQVTISNPSGSNSTGTWNGSNAEPNK